MSRPDGANGPARVGRVAVEGSEDPTGRPRGSASALILHEGKSAWNCRAKIPWTISPRGHLGTVGSGQIRFQDPVQKSKLAGRPRPANLSRSDISPAAETGYVAQFLLLTVFLIVTVVAFFVIASVESLLAGIRKLVVVLIQTIEQGITALSRAELLYI